MPNMFVLAAANHDIKFHLMIIVLGGIAAFMPRYIPLRIFTNRDLPEWFNEWMKYVPVCLFTSLVVKGIFITGESYRFALLGHPAQIIAALFVIVIAYLTRSMSMSVITGLVVVFLASLVL
ncbi:AzlD domain-containing protein [uncultured Limosilactobacillus sp.]|uniref:AzlD domain-containing protein n=1 Tax=uncultured Limosilactobacillus sp. TaxID=2837629 RepID=UPI0025FB4480|nr:AzlD domain-containing protein [uncultured Limosilactobacillus sp.]